MHYVGFDIGTSSLKTTVIDDSLKIVYESSYACEYDEPMEGYREIDPERWYVLVCQSLKEVQSKFSDIETIGITGQMHTTVFLDEKGEVIRPAIIWNDLRTSDLIASFKEELKDEVKQEVKNEIKEDVKRKSKDAIKGALRNLF